MKTKIHVNQHHIRSNKTKDTDLPVSCGARVVIETESEIKIIS